MLSHAFALQVPAQAWLRARAFTDEGAAAAREAVEATLAARLELFITNPQAAEEAAVLEALRLAGSNRKAAAALLGLPLRTFYKVFDGPGVREKALEQARALGHEVQEGPTGRPRVLDVPNLTESERAVLHKVHVATRRKAWFAGSDQAEDADLRALYGRGLLKVRRGVCGDRYQVKTSVMKKKA